MLSSIEEGIRAVAAGELVVVADDEDRENEGDLIMAAEKATPEKIAFMIRHTSGIICQPMTGERLDQLDLPQMVEQNTEAKRTAFTVSVDAREGTTTGVSAEDRMRTVTALADPETSADDFVVTRADDPRTLAREGLLGLGFTPVEADKLLDKARGETPEDLIAAALKGAR